MQQYTFKLSIYRSIDLSTLYDIERAIKEAVEKVLIRKEPTGKIPIGAVVVER